MLGTGRVPCPCGVHTDQIKCRRQCVHMQGHIKGDQRSQYSPKSPYHCHSHPEPLHHPGHHHPHQPRNCPSGMSVGSLEVWSPHPRRTKTTQGHAAAGHQEGPQVCRMPASDSKQAEVGSKGLATVPATAKCRNSHHVFKLHYAPGW